MKLNVFTIASAISGFALVSAGCAMIYRPFGVIVAGGLLLLAALTSANRRPQ